MKRTLLLLLCILGFAAAAQDTVKVSSFSPNRDDATAACQAALDSKAKTIVFDNPGFDYIVNPLFFHSNCDIVFEDGVVVRAMKGAFKDRNDCLFTGRNVENVTLRGIGTATLVMNKLDYQDPTQYRLGQWRHCVSLLTATNLSVRNLTIKSSGGDGVYVSTNTNSTVGGPVGAPCRNILLENLILDDHHRQGVSVISVDGLVIRKCRLSNSKGEDPQSGIDFEPNNPEEKLMNCLVEDCEFIDNTRAGLVVATGGLKNPIQLTVRNCLMQGNRSGIDINADWRPLVPSRGFIRFENCRSVNNGYPLVIMGNRKDLKVSFKDCVLDNAAGRGSYEIYLKTNYTDDFGGVDFGNMLLKHCPKSQAVVFEASVGAGLTRPGGSLTLIDADGKTSPFDLAAFTANNQRNEELMNFKSTPIETQNLLPASQTAKKAKAVGIRTNAVDFIQYADGVHPVNITFKTVWRRMTGRLPKTYAKIFAPDGRSAGDFTITSDDFTYTFKPAAAGTYRFRVNTGGRAMDIFSDAPGQAFGSERALGMHICNTRLYFHVPKGVKDICIEVAGEPPGEKLAAQLRDASGKVVAAVPHKAQVQLLKYTRVNADKTELWSIETLKVVEDYTLRLAAPLPPYFYTSPENAFNIK